MQPITLYISAASDLMAERALLGRAVAEIPLGLNWQIVQTPRHDDPLNRQALAIADVHWLLLGSDIRAPVGLEWLLARRAGRQPELFSKQGVARTPAAEAFVRDVIQQGGQWQPFGSAAALRRQLLPRLADWLARQAIRLSLTQAELETLHTWRETLQKDVTTEHDERTMASNSILLAPERYEPRDGIVLRPPKNK